ncbi:hypothetical protein [Ornithinibacillus bavariensis]|uniref:DUF2089 domain-containing protein n=1 Tax=Ornithinibacillus bavariensis TaxID=545502 RepID=A0A919X9I2_9BACI|nr:hypothetical protein [Ornithinibacillus bavariensis]GIO26630.1 hypothetical protein J43TS3_12410 [Ornithinibacillus bavariensis]
MKQEIAKVIRMMEEGKIDAEKATELISLLKEKEESGSTAKSTSYLDKTLKIRIKSEENDQVNVNLPIRLFQVLLRAGHGIASSIPEVEKYVKDLDVDLILAAIDQELEGRIVDISTNNGDKIDVYVE